ncbi:hypothetical protein [Candidatus Protochlamydia phocaeensis]|nr:hypothetical protein [Candidatus Protochlamydia phocaeensis]
MVATKTQAIDKQKALKVLNKFLDQFKNYCKQNSHLMPLILKIFFRDF